ncbi:MAG: acetyl-CoA C-acyltransferase [Candidatus Limnocylindrales bacterium]
MTRDLHRPLREAWIVEAARTPIGRYGGALATVRPDDLAALVLRAVVDRAGLDPALVEDVILGCANQAGEDNRDVARMAVLLAGLPVEVGGLTVNRLCGSGLQAINTAAHAIEVGDGDVFIGGGVESMTRAPHVMAKAGVAWERGARELQDTTLGWRFLNPKLAERYYPYSMGETAENVAERYGIGRERQDAFALESQRRAVAAIEAGRFADQIVPVEVAGSRGQTTVIDRDEHPRSDSSPESLARLKPAFRPNGGSVTAGNSSGINDGAAAVLLVEADRARALGLTPLARVVATAIAGVDPAIMGIGPVPATRKALERAGIGVVGPGSDRAERGVRVANRWPAWTSWTWTRHEVNVNGGAIALGHPLGMSGARMITMLTHELRAHGRPLRPRHDVHRGRSGHRDGDRASGRLSGISARRLSKPVVMRTIDHDVAVATADPPLQPPKEDAPR